MPTVSAFKWVPPFAQGHVRDLRVRWAFEEAGIRYDEHLIGHGEKNRPDYLALQPFGQVPALQDDGLDMFESGAIVLHIGERSEALLPTDPRRRAKAISWMFAALNSVEPIVQELGGLDAFHAGEEWARLRRPSAEAFATQRLASLAAALGDRDWLDGAFTAGDLLMVTVLRILHGSALLDAVPTLVAYRARGEARPAFQRALAAQLTVFRGHAPKG